VVQHYLDKPHLVDDLKYDFRLYVLVYGVDPLRIYLHSMAFARFCTTPYQKPSRANLSNIYMHLTNYAINKFASEYKECDDESGDQGHKRSLGAILKILEAEGCDTQTLMLKIKDSIIKTVVAAQPQLAHLYKICQPDCLDGSMAFQVLGFDVLLDHKYNPYLIEVNCSPSFATDSSLDYKIKKTVIADTFRLLNISREKRLRVQEEYYQKI
jgi:tubulin polyglutamylase TTLL6/13